MSNRNPTSLPSHLGPPSPTSSATTPTTPTALVPASRDFLVPIGSTGALQKFSVANAAQKRKTVADRRAQANAHAHVHIAAAEAGWHTPDPAPRAASSLGVSSYSSGYNASSRGGNHMHHPTGLAPVEVQHRPSSATGYSPTSSITSSSLSAQPSKSASRLRTISSHDSRPATAGAWMETQKGTFRPTQGQMSNVTNNSMASSNNRAEQGFSGTASPGEKKRTFTKGLRGLFSSGSSRKALASRDGGAQSPSIQQQQQHQQPNQSSGFWSGSSTTASSPYSSGFSTMTGSMHETFLEKDRWSGASSSNNHKPLPPPGGSQQSMRSASAQGSHPSSNAPQPPFSTLGSSARDGEVHAISGSAHSHIRGDSKARRTDSQRSRTTTHDRSTTGASTTETSDPPGRSRILSSLDPFAKSPQQSSDGGGYADRDGDQYSVDESTSTPRTPQLGASTDSRRESTGPPKLDFDLPSPGFYLDDMDRPPREGERETETSPRSQGRSRRGSAAERGDTSAAPSSSSLAGAAVVLEGGIGELARRRSSRVTNLGKPPPVRLGSIASSSSSSGGGGAGHPYARTADSSTSSAPSVDFQPGPSFGQFDSGPGVLNAPVLLRSPPTPVSPRPLSTANSSPLSVPPASGTQRSSVSSGMSQATSIAAITKGWQVEPDTNPPLHPSAVYGPRASGSMASLTSQESGVGASRSRRGSAAVSASVVSSDGRASVASTVVGRSNNATPLGRPFVNGSAGAGAGAGMGVGLDGSASSDTFAALSPNPLLAPLFERLPVGGAGTDDGVAGGMFSLGHGSFDSSNHHHHHGGLGSTVSHGANHSGGSGGNGSTMSHGNPGHGSSTIGHSTLGHGTQGHGTEDLGLAAAGSRSCSPRNSIQGHAQGSSASHAASFTTASSGGHGNGRPVGAPPSRRPGSSGGAAAAAAGGAAGGAAAPTTNKAGRPTTPRGGVVPGFEQPPTALRTTPSSHSRSASLKGASTRLDMDAAAGTASGSGSESSSLRGGAAPLLPSRSKDRPRLSRPSTAGSTKSTDTSLLMPLQDPAMLATLAKLESAQARSTASPLNLATFSEANLRSALVNGAVERPGRGPSGGGSEDGGDHLHRADGKSNGAVVGGGGGDSLSGSVDGASLAEKETKDVQEKTKATKAAVILNGLPVPEDADPKTYVPSNALTRTRRGAQVGAAAAKAAEQDEQLQAALKTPPTMQSSSSYDGRSPNRFSLDSDEDDDALRHRGRMGDDAPTPTPQTPTPSAPGYAARGRAEQEEEEEDDLSSSDGLVSDEDEQEGGDDESEVGQGGAAGVIISRGVSTDSHASRRSGAPAVENQMPANAWVEVEAALKRFRDDGGVAAAEAAAAAAASGGAAAAPSLADKGGLLRSILLPFLALEGETPSVDVPGPSKFRNGKARRALFFDWIRSLLGELQQTQTSADRGAILESIGCVLESRNLGARILERDAGDWEEFNSIFGLILGWAIGELNKKGVYQNTLIFTGRLLAIAFFRIHGVASKLLRALPVNRFALERVSSEADWDLGQPRSFERYRKRFPQHLREFCFQDARSYLKMLDGQTPPGVGDLDSDDDRYLVRQDEVEVEMAGNWLRRWQSDDSELFFSFIRSYHRQMSTLLTSTKRLRKISKWFFGGPGYAHLATSVHQKCLSMVHREIFSVTTLSSQKTFNPGETANVLSGSTAGKPRHLEAANRRCTAIVVEIARTGHPNTNAQLFSGMLGVHVKSVVKRTSLYDAEGVFCLLDWLDGIISHMDAAELPVDTFLDVDFLIDMVSMLLNTADHALALMRTIAFCYSNFAVLTSHKDTRLRFCESILLEPVIFHKLFLSWSVTIRAYFLHLLVFRLARISDFPNPKADPNGKTQVRVARLFNQRLDEIRRRYEELSPSIPTEDDGDDFTRFKNRPASFVSTIKHTASVHRPEAMSKAERILGIGLPDPAMASKSGADSAKQSLAAKWLRGLGAKGKKSRWNNGKAAVGMSETDSPTVNNEPRKKMLLLDELDFDDADVDSSGTDEEPSLGGEGTNGADSVSDAKMIAPAEGSAVVADSDIGMGDNITPDASFDLQSAAPPLAAGPGRSGASPRVSRAFSKRSSILPGPAFDLVGDETADTPPVPPLPGHVSHPYDKTLHTYAVQSLTEYERTIQEHDQYFGAQPETEKAQVPRLQVNWPAMWQD